jgi:uridine kinase
MSSMRGHSLSCMAQRIARRLKLISKNTTQSLVPIAAITGDGAIGKSILARAVAEKLQGAYVISTDSFLLDREQRRLRGSVTGDDPRAVNIDDLINKVKIASSREGVVTCKRYDHSTGRLLTGDTRLAEDIEFLLIEGAFAMHPRLRDFLSFAVFLDASYPVRHALRMIVDTKERGYSLTEFERNWPAYESIYQRYVKPNATLADMILKVTYGRLFAARQHEECICLDINDMSRRR